MANCTFTHNEAEEYGGGLGYSELVRNLDIVSNDFSYNHSDQGGGAICIRHSDYWEVLSLENSFYGNSVSLESGEGGGAILCNESRLLIMNPGQEPYDRDVFHWNTAAIGGAISVQGGSSVYIDYSTFRYNEAIYSGHGASGYGGAISVRDDSHLNLNHSVFLSNFGQHCSALECNFGAAATISHCTFAANRNDCFQVQASTMLFTSCIIAFTIDGSAFSCFQNSDINLYCTNIFGNQYYNWGYWCVSNYEGINGNMSLDPLFCGETIDTFESLFLRSDSPCADVPDCGLVGALPVNCEIGRASCRERV